MIRATRKFEREKNILEIWRHHREVCIYLHYTDFIRIACTLKNHSNIKQNVLLILLYFMNYMNNEFYFIFQLISYDMNMNKSLSIFLYGCNLLNTICNFKFHYFISNVSTFRFISTEKCKKISDCIQTYCYKTVQNLCFVP